MGFQVTTVNGVSHYCFGFDPLDDDAALGCMLDPVYSVIFVLPSLNIKKKKG